MTKAENPHKVGDLVAKTIDEVVVEDRQSSLLLPLVHSDLDDYGLDPYEFRIYAHRDALNRVKLDRL